MAQLIEKQNFDTKSKSEEIGEQLLLLLLKFLGNVLLTCWSFIFWCIAFIVAYQFNYLWLAIIAVILVIVLCVKYEPLKQLLPLYGDFIRVKSKIVRYKQLIAGNKFFRHVTLIDSRDKEKYPILMEQLHDRVRITVLKPIQGLSVQKMGETISYYLNVYNANEIRQELGKDGRVVFDLIQINALDVPVVIDKPADFDPSNMGVSCANDVNGNSYKLKFANLAGCLVSGSPGSGKTAGVSSFLTSLALSKDVDLSIIDCKGGADWSSYESASNTFLSVDGSFESFQRVQLILEKTKDEMLSRVALNREILGNSNFWNVPLKVRRKHNTKFKLVVIDECQELFINTSDKQLKSVLLEINNLVTTLIKRGRSAGICVLLITQKPTSDSIPTSIRDNCGLRIAFRLESTDAEKAALGTINEDPLSPRAINIPRDRKGGAVLVNDQGVREYVRFFYMPENVQETVLGGVINE